MKHNPLKLLLCLSIGSFLFLLTWCESDNSYSASYAHDIEPIFNTRCFPCHLSESGNSGNLNLSSYASLMAGNSDNGPVVLPGDVDNSLLYEAVSKPTEEQSILITRMPQGAEPLSPVSIKLFEDWINEGAKDN